MVSDDFFLIPSALIIHLTGLRHTTVQQCLFVFHIIIGASLHSLVYSNQVLVYFSNTVVYHIGMSFLCTSILIINYRFVVYIHGYSLGMIVTRTRACVNAPTPPALLSSTPDYRMIDLAAAE